MEWHITYYRKKSIRVNLPWKKFPWVSFKYKKHFTNKLGKCLISLGNPFCIKPKFDTFYGGTLKQLFIRISELTYIWPTKYSNIICWIWPSPLNAGLNKLHPQWQACTQCAHKEVFACTKLCARKSIKTPLHSTWMLFKLVSYFCVWKQIVFGTIKSDIHNLFQLRSCCFK